MKTTNEKTINKVMELVLIISTITWFGSIVLTFFQCLIGA